MKLTALLTSLFFFASIATSQTWQSINSNYISPINVFTASGGTYPSKWFKLNPYDNSLWMGWNDQIQTLRNDGLIELFDYTTDPILHQFGNMIEFDFTTTHAYVLDENNGLFRYDGSTWSSVFLANWGSHLSSDADTVWMCRGNNTNYIYSYDGFSFQGSGIYPRRIQSRNGEIWISFSHDSDISKLEGGSYYLYSPDTSFLLDWSNYDFKFAKKTDTLYVAGDSGFSLAYNSQFIDTITPGNSTNMPSGPIIEFEFDNQNNIWAVFGNTSFYANTIAYYDQMTETWSQIYNSSNSPIDYTKRISIEVDTSGNLWVTDGQYLHILKINNPPAWLGSPELEKDDNISIYPNPSNGTINLSVNDNATATSIEITDLSGRLLKTMTYSHQRDLNLKAGQYFIRLLEGDSILGVEKIVIE